MDFMIQKTLQLVETGKVPDRVIRTGIRALSKKRLVQEGRKDPALATQRYIETLAMLKNSEIAIETDKANEQHYELPTAFFQAVLGRRLKYSASLFETNTQDLDQAEEAALASYCERAQLQDGQAILEIVCGWGSLSLYMAEHFPKSQITVVSNSSSQRKYIEQQAEKYNFSNLKVITCDVNVLDLPKASFDRVVSVEMFEHVRNYQKLFANISQWLKDDGLLWCHIFCHRFLHYPFEVKSEYDWMSKYFFTGGLMPASTTFLHFQADLELVKQWQWSGKAYEHTANAWLKRMDAKKAELQPIFAATYGDDAVIWWQRWRVFFMACAELFGYDQGREWVIGHFLFKKKAIQ